MRFLSSQGPLVGSKGRAAGGRLATVAEVVVVGVVVGMVVVVVAGVVDVGALVGLVVYGVGSVVVVYGVLGSMVVVYGVVPGTLVGVVEVVTTQAELLLAPVEAVVAPVGQARQAEAPAEGWKVPTPQDTHEPAEVMPVPD